jgi:hypothetical protein
MGKKVEKTSCLGNSLVVTTSTTELVDDEHETFFAKAGEIRPELIVGNALLDTLISTDKLEEDESSKEVDDDEDGETAQEKNQFGGGKG